MQYEANASHLILTAARWSRDLGHSYVGSEHLLLALTQEPGWTGQLLHSSGLDTDLVQLFTKGLRGSGRSDLPLPQGLTKSAKGILRGAAMEARRLQSRDVGSLHILLSLLRRQNTGAQELLTAVGADRDALFTGTVDHLRWEAVGPVKMKKEAVATKLLEQFSEDLVLKASTMEPVVGRDREIDMVIGILSRKNKNNPALVGEPGVGKTAIAEGLAQRMALGKVPPQLKEKRLMSQAHNQSRRWPVW